MAFALEPSKSAPYVRCSRVLIEAAFFLLYPSKNWKQEAIAITNASNAVYTMKDPNKGDYIEWQIEGPKGCAMETIQYLFNAETQIGFLVNQLLEEHAIYDVTDFTDAHGLLKSARNQMLFAQEEPWRYLQRFLIEVPSQQDTKLITNLVGEA